MPITVVIKAVIFCNKLWRMVRIPFWNDRPNTISAKPTHRRCAIIHCGDTFESASVLSTHTRFVSNIPLFFRPDKLQTSEYPLCTNRSYVSATHLNDVGFTLPVLHVRARNTVSSLQLSATTTKWTSKQYPMSLAKAWAAWLATSMDCIQSTIVSSSWWAGTTTSA